MEQPEEELKQPEQVDPEESFNSYDSIKDDSSDKDSTDDFLSKITEDK